MKHILRVDVDGVMKPRISSVKPPQITFIRLEDLL